MPKTIRRQLWELAESLWILPTFALGLFPWVSFFYIGLRARQRKWILAGALYSILPIAVLFLEGTTLYYEEIGRWVTCLMLIVGLISIAHAFVVRREYLLRRDALNEIQRSGREEERLRQRIAREYGLNPFKALGGSAAAAAKPVTVEAAGAGNDPAASVGQPPLAGTAPVPPSLIDLNGADEQSLASLPGITIILAKRAVSLRQTRNGFQSVEDFGQALGVKPHMIERIRPLVTVRPPSRPERTGSAGRVVDY